MNINLIKFFIRFFQNHIFKSPKQLMVFLLLVVFLFFGMVFYVSVDTFEEVYINNIKGFYPEIYIPIHRDEIPKLRPDVLTYHEEVFEVSNEIIFKLTIDEPEKIFLNVGLRAIDGNHLSNIVPLKNVENHQQTIWINASFKQKIIKTSNYDGKGIYLKSRRGKFHYVMLSDLDFISGGENKDWMVFSAALAAQLGILPNIIGVYPSTGADIAFEEIDKNFAEEGHAVFQWSDRLPFFNVVFLKLGKRLYGVFIFISAFITGYLLISVFHDLFLEFQKIIQFSIIYGLKGYFIYLIFIFFGLTYGFLCFAFSFGLAVLLKGVICSILPLLSFDNLFLMYLYSFGLLAPVIVFVSSFAVYRSFKKGYTGIVEI